MSIENARRYLLICLNNKTLNCIPTIDDKIVNMIQQSFANEKEYNDKIIWITWFAIRILFAKGFKDIISADIISDILSNQDEYTIAYNITDNSLTKDRITTLKSFMLVNTIERDVMQNINKITKYCKDHNILIDCPAKIPSKLQSKITSTRYVPNPDTEITRVIKYLRALLYNQDYHFVSNNNRFDLVDWVTQHATETNKQDIYCVWFAVRLLILNGFTKVSFEDIEQKLIYSHPHEFKKACSDNQPINVVNYIRFIANNILQMCNEYGGSFKYTDQEDSIPYSL